MDYTRVKIYTESNNLELVAFNAEEKGIPAFRIEEAQTFLEFLDKKNLLIGTISILQWSN